MHTTTLRKVGGSVMMAVPRAVLDLLELQAGTTVGIAVRNGRLVVEPKRRPKYSLSELLRQCNTKAQRTQDEQEWAAGKPVGRELI